MMKCLAIIPARSGSKGIKDKNIKDLNGKPLMAYTIECALKSKIFDEVMVSTDSQKYADIAENFGANVPFLRSEETASDVASTYDVIVEVINEYKKIGKIFDDLCILQPTSPLRTVDDITNAYKLYKERNSIAVVSVCEVDHSPLWCNTLPDDCSLNGFIRNVSTRRQDVEKYYRVNGAIYFVKVDEYLDNANLYRKGCYAYIMDKMHSIDIDDENDFFLAQYYLFNRNVL